VEPPARLREGLVAAGLPGDDVAVPRVVLKLRDPLAAPSPTQQLAAEWLARLPLEASLWPSGGNWMPNTKNWGTRSPIAFGCGKCRWRPLGCRGCIAAAEGYCSPTPPPLPPGTVSIPKRGVDEDCDRVDAASDDVPDRHSGLRRLLSSVAVVSEGVVDDEGSGVVARKLIRKGELLIDPSVIFVARPSGYAQAHLPQYHALELGSMGYFRLRDPAYAHCSLTYYVNEAGHLDSPGPEPNVRYKVVRPRGGGISLGLEALMDISMGSELLCRYNQKL